MNTTLALTARLVLMLGMSVPGVAYAAGFDCTMATSNSEKTICADSTLSQLDSALAITWKQALTRDGDTSAMKVAQREWLKQREACGRDVHCLADRYRERLSALSKSAIHLDDRWQQSWSMDIVSSTSGGELIFTGKLPNLRFTITANAGANEGGMEGDVVVRDNHASFRQGQCRLDFTRQGLRIKIQQQGTDADCQGGLGVFYAGTYIPTAQFKARPQPDLLSLHVLDDPRQNRAAHALLGKDYGTLVDNVNQGAQDEDKDGLGATVMEYWVRGIAPTNAAIVMHKGEQLWIGLLVFDAHNKVRLRYYTNVPSWKKVIPKTIRDWHDNSDSGAYKEVPVDFMS